MRATGVIEDGHAFTEEDLERGTPRFWWGPRKRAAFDRALARRGLSRRERDDEDGHEASGDDRDGWSPAGVVAVMALADEPMKKTERGGDSTGSDGFGEAGGATDGGGSSSDSGGGDSGGGSAE